MQDFNMVLTCFGTGSSGNSYLLQHSCGSSIIIDLGVNFTQILPLLNFNLDHVMGCIVSHEHKDHCKFVDQALRYRLDVYSNVPELISADVDNAYLHRISAGTVMTDFSPTFTILPFKVEHDAVDPLGFLIQADKCKILFITDSYFTRYKFTDIDYLIIECNFDEETLKENEPDLNEKYVDRLKVSHMSLERLIEFIDVQQLHTLKHIVLIHGSNKNLDKEKTISAIDAVTVGTKITIAKKGMMLPL